MDRLCLSEREDFKIAVMAFRVLHVFKCRRKIDKDGDDCTSEGREFHVMAAATGNDRRPTVDSQTNDENEVR